MYLYTNKCAKISKFLLADWSIKVSRDWVNYNVDLPETEELESFFTLSGIVSSPPLPVNRDCLGTQFPNFHQLNKKSEVKNCYFTCS